MANQPNFLKEFIDLYRHHKCLWKIKDAGYTNKALRTRAYEELAQLYTTVDPQATVDTVKNKINNIRSAFRKELKKVKQSKKSGADDVYIPSLWYYDSLLFTVEDKAEDRDTRSNCGVLFQDEEDNSSEQNIKTDSENEIDDPLLLLAPSGPASAATSTPPPPRNRSKRQKTDALFEKPEEIEGVLEKPANEFATVGENVAWKLQRMREDQRNIAEHLINTVLYYGLTNKLSDCSNIN